MPSSATGAAPDPRTIFALAVALGCGLAAEPARASGELVLIPDPQLLLIMLVGFVLLIFPLNTFLFKPIFAALDARKERIEGARDRSVQLARDADSVLERYESAIREARSDAETRRQSQLESAREEQLRLTAAARREAEGELEHARTELDRSLEAARATLRSSAEELAQAAAEQVLGRSLS
jgi:F-type H+-transporting ATPase subunit b